MSESISVIAGNGELPIKVLQNIIKKGIKADVVGIKGEFDKRIIQLSNRIESIKYFEIDRCVEILNKFQNKEVMFVGGVSKIGLLNMFRPDAIKNLLKLKSLSDESIFKGIINLLNDSGFKVISFAQYYEEGITREGILCGEEPDSQTLRDANYGRDFIKHNSDFAIGQSVIVKNESIVAVETVSGTDNMLKIFIKNPIKDSIFVKCSKDNQDLRIDLPSIGRRTIDLLYKGRIKWVFLEAGKTIIIGDNDTIQYASKKGINLCGIR